jgi:hypothetical protein
LLFSLLTVGIAIDGVEYRERDENITGKEK